MTEKATPVVPEITLSNFLNDAVGKRQTQFTVNASASTRGVLLHIFPNGDPGSGLQFFVDGNKLIPV